MTVSDLRPVRRVRDPFRLVRQQPRQVGVEARIIDLERRQHMPGEPGIADDPDRVFGPGQEFLDQDRPARHLLAQMAEAGDRLLPAVHDRGLGDADRGIAVAFGLIKAGNTEGIVAAKSSELK